MRPHELEPYCPDDIQIERKDKFISLSDAADAIESAMLAEMDFQREKNFSADKVTHLRNAWIEKISVLRRIDKYDY